MMQFFCGLFIGHNFELIDKKFVAPTLKIARSRGEMESEIAMLALGYTTTFMKCKRCGQTKTERLIGQY